MPNKELIGYVSQALQSGLSEKDIKDHLLVIGWRKEDVDEVFDSLKLPNKGKKIRKIIFIVLGLVLLVGLVALLTRITGLFNKNTSPVSRNELSAALSPIPDSENAYFDLLKMKDVIYSAGDQRLFMEILSGQKWDETIVKDVVSNNSEAYKIFELSASKPRFQDPAFLGPLMKSDEVSLLGLLDTLSIGRVVKTRVLYFAAQNRSKEALDDALALVSLGDKIEASRGLVWEYMFGSNIKELGLGSIRQILPRLDVDEVDLKKYLKDLDKFGENKIHVTDSLRTQHLLLSEFVDAVSQGDKDAVSSVFGGSAADDAEFSSKSVDEYYLQPDETKKMFEDDINEAISSIDGSCLKSPENIDETDEYISRMYTERNGVGKMIHAVITSGVDIIRNIKCDEDLSFGLTQAAVAFRSYKEDKGTLPDSLNVLVPGYLKSVPIDPFNGGPLRYSPEKKIIYSIGDDYKDSGGSLPSESLLIADDPSVSVDF